MHAAVICYMAASNMDKAVEIWTRGQAAAVEVKKSPFGAASSSAGAGGNASSIRLHEAIEKISILAVACAKYVSSCISFSYPLPCTLYPLSRTLAPVSDSVVFVCGVADNPAVHLRVLFCR